MKSFIRVKKINGQEYLYEITPYYDKEKKQIRQKSKYLGKNVNGVPIKVRSQDQIPKKVLSHCEFMPLLKNWRRFFLTFVQTKKFGPF